MSTNVREYTIKILEAVDDGTLSPQAVVEACMSYMSEADVADMAHKNELFPYEEDED